jgi:hypothetical protein
MSTDPVTADFQAWKIIRRREGKPYSVNNLPLFLKSSAGIDCSINPIYNIGIVNEKQMDMREEVNGRQLRKSSSKSDSLIAFEAGAFAFIDFFADESLLGKTVPVSIYSKQGKP